MSETNALGHVNYTKEELQAAYNAITNGCTRFECIEAVNEAGGNDRPESSATAIRNKLSKALKARGKKLPAFKRVGGGRQTSGVLDDLFGELDLDELPDLVTDNVEEDPEEEEFEEEVELD